MLVPIVAKPGSTLSYETGSWRTEVKPKFLHKNCIACGLCYLVCPEGCITGEGKNTFTADYRYCKGCGLCAYVCPKKDIVMVPEEEKLKE